MVDSARHHSRKYLNSRRTKDLSALSVLSPHPLAIDLRCLPNNGIVILRSTLTVERSVWVIRRFNDLFGWTSLCATECNSDTSAMLRVIERLNRVSRIAQEGSNSHVKILTTHCLIVGCGAPTCRFLTQLHVARNTRLSVCERAHSLTNG